MSINDLLKEIYESKCSSIDVERTMMRLGNDGGEGDFCIVKLKINEKAIEFDNSKGNWAYKA